MGTDPVQFTVSGITARLFEIIQKTSKQKQKELILLAGDEREYERIPYLKAIEYQMNDTTCEDFILDISLGGTFIETQKTLPIGQKIDLNLKFQDRTSPCIVTGEIAWSSNNGIGIQFVFKTPGEKQNFKFTIDSLLENNAIK